MDRIPKSVKKRIFGSVMMRTDRVCARYGLAVRLRVNRMPCLLQSMKRAKKSNKSTKSSKSKKSRKEKGKSKSKAKKGKKQRLRALRSVVTQGVLLLLV